ncbi:MAG TPA: YfcE family phosphodiesterase [Terriglobales bacterium]|nr:YfcE family phosphodiesterase [Terriglobales bacterium]
MTLLIISDTHGVITPALRCIETHPEVTGIIHLGDTTADARLIARQSGLPVTAVLGNNDRGEPGPAERKVVFGGVKMLLMHGHTRFVERGLANALTVAAEAGADMLMYGHTHFFYYRVHEGLHVLNPGSAGGVKVLSATAALLEVEGGEVRSVDMLTL